MKTTTEFLKAYHADPFGVRMKIERAARRARAEAMSRFGAKATGFIAAAALLMLIGPLAWAEAPVSEQAVALTPTDSRLQWGPCPAFLPKGCGLAVLHGDSAKNNADVFFRVPGKSTIALHWHTSAERMVLVAGELRITYDGQKEAVLKPGTYAYGPARKAHSGYCASKDPCVLFIAFESPVDAVPAEAPAK